MTDAAHPGSRPAGQAAGEADARLELASETLQLMPERTAYWERARTLYRRLDWLLNDDRPFELKGEHYVVAGMEERLALSIQRPVYAPEVPVFSPLVEAPLLIEAEPELPRAARN